MLVCVGGDEAGGDGELEDRVHAEARVGINCFADAVDKSHGEVGGVDAAREDQCVVVVNGLVVQD